MGIEEGISTGEGAECVEEIRCFTSEPVSNGFGFEFVNDSGDGSSWASDSFRAYKRRRMLRSSSKIKGQDGGRVSKDQIYFDKSSKYDSNASHEGKQKCSSHVGQIPNGTKHIAEGLEGFNLMEFRSLCKLLFDNFQGIKLDRLFHLSLINSRMKNGVYERAPMLFSSDVHEVGCSHGAVEKDKHEFCAPESEHLVIAEQNVACGVNKICTCSHCGEKADGKNCLVCDSCEEVYHVACIEPAVRDIPPKSWYCSSCTANGIGSLHENCVECERLNAPRILNNSAADENYNVNRETFTESEENANCSVDNELQLSPGSKNPEVCKICGSAVEKIENLRSCEHPFCPIKYYHARTCLVDKDDDEIVLCDGCDAAYHIYYMKPPRTTIPRGKWFCRKCDAGQRIRRAKRAYLNPENKLNMKGIGGKIAYDNLEMTRSQKDKEESDKSRGGVDMLLTAASTLHF
ncbi:hypothetical protein PTKIN_Ptkin09bG0172700 [Pterospermum kingtungense]